MRPGLLAAVVVLPLLLSLPSGASAQLVDRGYSLDVIDLPVLGATRALGLGGAFASAGEGINAMSWNPAAVGKRAWWETSFFDWDVAFGVMFPSRSNADRFFGSTPGMDVRVDEFTYYDVGFRLQFGPAAVGAIFRPRDFHSGDQTIRSQTGHVDFAWSFFGGELVVGAGARVVSLSVTDTTLDDVVFEITNANFEAGATFAPIDYPFRSAIAVRAPIDARPDEGNAALAGYAVPERVVMPWEVTLSGTYGFGERRLNPPMIRAPRPHVRRRIERSRHRRVLRMLDAGDPVVAGATENEAAVDMESDPMPLLYPEDPRRQRYGIVTMDLVIQGRVENGIGLDGFITQTERRWGGRTTVSPRLGIEGEPWLDRLKLRGGVYLEPHRSDLADPRVHFTQGFDCRLFSTDVFGLFGDPFGVQVSFATDFAKEYFNFGIGVGFWH